MRPDTRDCLADARAAALETVELAGPGWELDRIRALAIERLLMIVGEAMVRIRSAEEGVLSGIADFQLFIGMRNVLVHGYDALDPARIDAAIQDNLPALIREVDELLGGEN